MRTTVTLDSDTEQIIRRRMTERRVSFKQALNDLVRESRAAVGERPKFQTASRSLGLPSMELDKALRLAGQLEDDELVRRLEVGS